jgi:FMN phosphatase YigB (HAD superfamily)
MAHSLDIVMVDIDHTLFDADRPRDQAARRALATLLPSSEVDATMMVYDAVVRRWRLFVAMGYPNFRQVYDLPEHLGIVLRLHEASKGITPADRCLWDDWSAVAAATAPVETAAPFHHTDRAAEVGARRAARSAAGRRLAAALAETDVSFGRLVEASALISPRAFEMRAYADLLPFFAVVSAKKRVYLVTEGDDRIQSLKADALGLARYVPTERILSTSVASDPCGVRAELDAIEASADATDATKQAVRFLRRWLDRFAVKSNPEFYARVLQAICFDPENPRSALESMAYPAPLQWQKAGLRAAMVGDRYDSDVYPLTSQFGRGVLTVRVRRGKYGDTHVAPPARLAPTVTVPDLAGAAAFLTDERNWRAAKPITYPRIARRTDPDRIAAALSVTRGFPADSGVRRLGDLLAGAARAN